MSSTDGEDYHPSDGWALRQHHLRKEQLWQRICEEAQQVYLGVCVFVCVCSCGSATVRRHNKSMLKHV